MAEMLELLDKSQALAAAAAAGTAAHGGAARLPGALRGGRGRGRAGGAAGLSASLCSFYRLSIVGDRLPPQEKNVQPACDVIRRA